MNIFWPILLIFSLLLTSDARVARGSVSLSSKNPWKYLDKFGFDYGSGTYRIKMRTSGPGNYDKKFLDVQVQVFVDDKMNQALAKSDVCDRKQFSSVARTVPITQGQWSSPMYGRLTQRLRPHVWFFAIDRCSIPVTQSYFNVEYEIEFLQEDGSHFSMEQRGALFWNFMHLLLVAGVTGFTIFREIKVIQGGDKLHVVLQFLNVILLVNLSALFGKLTHNWIYSGDGEGFAAFDVLGSFFGAVCEITLTSLIMLLGMGFTFTVDHVRGLKREARYVLIAVCAMHVLLSFLSRLGKDERYQYSELEGATGWFLAAVRFAVTGWHIYNCRNTARKTSPKQAVFIQKFCVMSALYLAVFPSLYIISEAFLAQYNRLRLVTHFGFFAQFICIAWCVFLFTGRKSEYFQVSTLSSSYLPASFLGQVMDINWMTDSPYETKTTRPFSSSSSSLNTQNTSNAYGGQPAFNISPVYNPGGFAGSTPVPSNSFGASVSNNNYQQNLQTPTTTVEYSSPYSAQFNSANQASFYPQQQQPPSASVPHQSSTSSFGAYGMAGGLPSFGGFGQPAKTHKD
eukprot:GDKJ01045003.1.p1 GENE.GDKJ01045003.1~~GDKJ01045003.1.p1  ORF type:complete len:568 (+),score=100.17 GDKJ01045003.1:32-1735(+)